MVNIRIPIWPTDTGLIHVKSHYEIATDDQFTDIIDSYEGTEVNDGLSIYHSAAAVPEGTVYYGRVRREFEDGSFSDWLGPKPIYGTNAKTNRSIKPHTIISAPEVKFTFDPNDTSDYVVFETSKPLIHKGDASHSSTHWFLMTITGAIIYKSLYNENNKTQIFLDRSIIPVGISFKMYAAHVCSDGVESLFNSKTYNV